MGMNFSSAETPSSRVAAWAERPVIVRRKTSEPSQAVTSASWVGSVTSAASAR
jgi:hypothetical protein